MAKITREFIESKAIAAHSYYKPIDERGYMTTYVCAVQTPGGASHKMEFTVYSDTPDKVYSGARPHCGSRRILGQHTGAFVDVVTCRKC